MDGENVDVLEIKDPVEIIPDDEAVVIAYIDGEGEFTYPLIQYRGDESQKSGQNPYENSIRGDFEQVSNALREDTLKFHDLSKQSKEELGNGTITKGFDKKDVVDPPYPPKCLANFLEVDPVFFRAVKAKVLDSVGRDYQIQARWPIRLEGVNEDDGRTITADQFRADQETIVNFIENCNETIGFRGVLERAAMDYESIGWAAIEVIRNRKGLVSHIEHIPAQRIRVLKGFNGFVEITSDAGDPSGGYGRYYQRFGHKYRVREAGEQIPYDPSVHGIRKEKDLITNFVDYRTGEPGAKFEQSANEVLYIPKHHSNTIYYGYSDAIPALGAIVGNVYIRDYILQFFEHNTVPRYAVIIKGAKIDDQFRKLITEYFQTNIKGNAHKTLILTLQGHSSKEVTIDFERLDADQKEADFLQTQKQNSERIMTAMGTSPAILGIAEHSELGSGKGLSQAEIYKDRIVDPCQRHWAEKLNLLFRKGLGIKHAVLKFDPLDIRDMMLEMQYWTGMQNAGNATVNEVRKATGIGEPLAGADTAFVRIKEGAAFKISDLPKLEPPPTREEQLQAKVPASQPLDETKDQDIDDESAPEMSGE